MPDAAGSVSHGRRRTPRGRRFACPILPFVWSVALAAGLAVAAAAEPPTFRRTLDRVASLDPVAAASAYAARAVGLVYECLLEYDYAARPYRLIPGLAASLPEVSPDGLVYLIRLDPAASFAPDPCFGLDTGGLPRGRPVSAADVVYSLRRLADARLASPGYWTIEGRIQGLAGFRERSAHVQGDLAEVPWEGVSAPDQHTVRIELARPCPQFAWVLAMAYTAVVPEEAVRTYGPAFSDHPVGSGAYRLASWQRNYTMVFERWPDWRGWRLGPAAFDPAGPERPFDRLIFRVMDDATTQWLSFLSGELDFQGEIARDHWDAVIGPQGALNDRLARRGIHLASMPTLEVAYIGINMEDPLLGPNRALRQALNCAFDGARWEAFYNQRVTAADGPVPPGVAGRLERPAAFAFDLERARRLLAEAGYPDGREPRTGRRLTLRLDLGRTNQDTRESTELLVAFMDRVGLDLQPEYHNWPSFLQKVSRRESQMFRIGWVGDYPDAENFLQLFYGRNSSPGPNRCNYANPEFDQLYEAALSVTDPAERLRLYGAMQQIVREDCPWVFLHFPRSHSLYRTRVGNYAPHDFPYGMEKYLRVRAR